MMTQHTAAFVMTINEGNAPTLGGYCDQALYKLDPLMTREKWDDEGELEIAEYVVVSAVKNDFVHETYIFTADQHGKILDWHEWPGSYRYGTSHARALENAGYTMA